MPISCWHVGKCGPRSPGLLRTHDLAYLSGVGCSWDQEPPPPHARKSKAMPHAPSLSHKDKNTFLKICRRHQPATSSGPNWPQTWEYAKTKLPCLNHPAYRFCLARIEEPLGFLERWKGELWESRHYERCYRNHFGSTGICGKARCGNKKGRFLALCMSSA